MSVVKTIGRGVAWNAASSLVGKFVIFANLFIILQQLSVYAYGLTQLVVSVVSTLGIFLLPGLSSAILADLSVERARGEFGKMKSLFLRFFLLSFLLAGIAWALLFFGSDTAARLAGNSTIGYLLKIISFSLLIAPLRTMTTLLAMVELRYFDQSFYGIIEEIAKLASMFVAFYLLHLGADGLLYAVVVSQVITVLVFVPRSISAYRVFSAAQATNPGLFWEIIYKHRKWSVAANYVGQLGNTIQLWIIRLLLGTEAVGLFAFADGIMSQVMAVLPLPSVLAPLLPRYVDHPTEFARFVRSAVKVQALITPILIIATFIGLPLLVIIFPKYQPAVPIIMVLIWVVIPSGIGSVYTPAFTALKAQRAFFASITWKVFFVTIFTPPSILIFGLKGIAVGFVLAGLASTIERTWRLQKILPEFIGSPQDLLSFDPSERKIMRRMWEQIVPVRIRGLMQR